MSILYKKRLECVDKDKHHNKFYEITLEEQSGEYSVNARYGPIGKSGRIEPKYNGSSKTTAEKIVRELYQQKLKKYKDIG